jgi:hypothetical protein
MGASYDTSSVPINHALVDTNGGLNDQHGDEWDTNMVAILDSESGWEPEDCEDRKKNKNIHLFISF